MKLIGKYGLIRAMHSGIVLAITDWISVVPGLRITACRSTHSLQLAYAEGQKQQIRRDIRHGALFMTNHRDIVMDSAFLSLLLRTHFGIRPYIGIGNNLFGKWWIEPFVRFNRAFVVIRDGSPRELLQHSQLMSAYIAHLRRCNKSIWIAQREGRAKDSNDLTQPAVLKMLTIGNDDFLTAIRRLNICPVSLSYEYDPCDYLKAQEMQLKRDDPQWHKTRQDDLLSMSTGIKGHKGRVVFRLTPSVNHWIDAHSTELAALSRNEQIRAVAEQIDRQIHANYELFDRGADFETYLQQQVQRINLPNKDDAFLSEKIHEMYANPVRNYEKSHLSGVL